MTTPGKQTIRDIADWQGKTTLVREDFNVPLDAHGAITDDTRIRASIPTLTYLLEAGAKVVVLSHLGRPKNGPDPKLSLRPVANRLASLLPASAHVQLADGVYDETVVAQVKALQPGQLLLLENTRFVAGEEKNDPAFAKQLANLGDVFVNDAFGASHRAHASTEGIAHFISTTVAGLLMQTEIETMSRIINNPTHPFTAIIGGSKVSTKITVLKNLIPKVDHLIIGGGMRYTFLKALGYEVGASLIETDYLELAKELMALARQHQVEFLLPPDVVVADGFSNDAQHQVVDSEHIPAGWQGLDIGPKSIEAISAILRRSHSVLWNGPLGVFEFPNFAAGTRAVAELLAKLPGVQTVLGGGDTVAAIEAFGIDPGCYTHVSTGGGASLEFLEGKTLPGIAVIQDKLVTAATT